VFAVLLVAVTGLICIIPNYIQLWQQEKKRLKEKREEIYYEFLLMKNTTKAMLLDEELIKELDNNYEDTNRKNAELISKAELYLDNEVVERMREIVTRFSYLYPGEIQKNNTAENVARLNSLIDEILTLMRNDIGA